MSEDVAKYSKTLRKFKVLAKSLPRQDCKSYASPYAKFDKIRGKEDEKEIPQSRVLYNRLDMAYTLISYPHTRHYRRMVRKAV